MTQIFQLRAAFAMPPDQQSGNPRLGRQSPTSRAPQEGNNQSERRKQRTTLLA